MYFNEGVLVTRGFSVGPYRDRLRQAIQIWNEESTSVVRLYYAGDTTATSMTGAVVVNHVDYYDCSGYGVCGFGENIGGSEPACDNRQIHINIHIWNTCLSGNYPVRPYLPGSGQDSYEGCLAHELGHAAYNLGHPPAGTNDSIMVSPIGSQMLPWLLLYDKDQDCIVSEEGTTTYDQATIRTTNSGTSWSSNSVPSSSLLSTFGPAVAQGTGTSPLRLAGHNAIWRYLWIGDGSHAGTWTQWTSPSNGGIANVESWIDVAHSSPWGETVAVWLDDCTATFCPIRWAWTDNSGSSWLTGTFDGGTRMRPMVAYDPGGDRFVVAVLGTDHKIYTRHVPAVSGSGWSNWVGTNPGPKFRYTGGLVFANSGTPGSGLLAAAVDRSSDDSGVIMQMQITRNGAGDYIPGSPYYARDSAPWSYRTARHFDMTRRNGTGTQQVMMVWRDHAEDCFRGRGLMYSATKSSLSSLDDFSTRVSSGHCVYNSVSVAAEASAGIFTAGVIRP